MIRNRFDLDWLKTSVGRTSVIITTHVIFAFAIHLLIPLDVRFQSCANFTNFAGIAPFYWRYLQSALPALLIQISVLVIIWKRYPFAITQSRTFWSACFAVAFTGMILIVSVPSSIIEVAAGPLECCW
jgi:hypothetical protein